MNVRMCFIFTAQDYQNMYISIVFWKKALILGINDTDLFFNLLGVVSSQLHDKEMLVLHAISLHRTIENLGTV